MTAISELRTQAHRNTDRAWGYFPLPLTALALGFAFILAGVNIAAFLLGLPVISLVVAVLGDSLLILAILRLRRTGRSVDDLLSAPAPGRR